MIMHFEGLNPPEWSSTVGKTDEASPEQAVAKAATAGKEQDSLCNDIGFENITRTKVQCRVPIVSQLSLCPCGAFDMKA